MLKNFKDAANLDFAYSFNDALGRVAAGNAKSFCLSNEDSAALGLAADAAWNGVAGSASLVALMKALTSVALDNTTLALTKAILAGDSIAVGGVSLTPKFKLIAAAANGANIIVAAVAGKKIRVLSYNLMAAGAVNAKWQTSTGPVDLTGLKYFAAAGGGIAPPFNPLGLFETAAGDSLNLNLSAAVGVGGEIVYIEV